MSIQYSKGYRHYYTVKPCQSRLLQMQWDQRYYNEHLKKIAEAKPMVDTKAPKTYVHMHLKLKKIALEEERLFIIERDNRILLEKMSHIMRTRGRIDNKNDYIPKSLNKEKRQRELLRVILENQGIIKRIQDAETSGEREDWKRDWSRSLTFMDNISRYQHNWWETDKRSSAKSCKSSKKSEKDENEPEESEEQPNNDHEESENQDN